MTETLQEPLVAIPQQAQRQDGTRAQLLDLERFAVKLGLYDAAEVLRGVLNRQYRNRRGKT